MERSDLKRADSGSTDETESAGSTDETESVGSTDETESAGSTDETESAGSTDAVVSAADWQKNSSIPETVETLLPLFALSLLWPYMYSFSLALVNETYARLIVSIAESTHSLSNSLWKIVEYKL